MTTQRDRLAEVIHEEVWDRSSTHSSSCVNCKADADKLIRRGVRLIDLDTLTAALHRAELNGAFGFHDGAGCVHDEWATDIIAALDRVAQS